MICPKCGAKMIIKNNSKLNIKFLGCSGFPNCKHTKEYIEPSENIIFIQNIIKKHEEKIREKLMLPDFITVTHEYCIDMKEAAVCTPISQRDFLIKWNTELKRTTLAKFVIDLAHEYRHVYQHYYNTMGAYDETIQWRLRPHEEDAIRFSYEYLDEVIMQ